MKISVWWLLAIPVLIAGIAKSEGAHGVFWEYEMKQPEFQRTIKEYVERKCFITLTTREIEHAKADSVPAYANVNCLVEDHHGEN